jgi:hypothetical protein
MSNNKKTITLGKTKQLIDLNGDSTNFDLSFKVTCHDDTPYNLLVVDQTTLDNTEELQYKEAKKSISGNIVVDKNVYQNYFLIIKSEKPCIVDIEITKKVLPKTPVGPVEDSPYIQSGDNRVTHTITSPSSTFPWKKIILISIILVVGIAVLWWLYKRKGSDTPENPILEDKLGEHNLVISPVHSYKPTIPVVSSPALSSVGDSRGYTPNETNMFKTTHSVSPDVMSKASDRSEVGGNSLLDRLRKFAR